MADNLKIFGTTYENVSGFKATDDDDNTITYTKAPSGAKSITANGTSIDVAEYATVNVAVPASAVDSGTKSITSNGTGIDVVGYSAVDVAVPNSYSSGDEGKVVSSGALVNQSSQTVIDNGTYDTTLKNSVTVAIPSASGVSF